MSNETKQDVFDDALAYAPVGMEYGPVNNDEAGDLRSCLSARYAAALPDDLSVIPKAVGEYIKKAKSPGKWGLLDVFWHLGDHISAIGFNGLYDWERWMIDNQDAVSRAWLDGAWHVEETGEIVKLEEEK